MVDYSITRDVLSSDKHLVHVGDGFAWRDELPAHVMTYDSDFLQSDCVRTSMHLVGKTFDDRKGIEAYAKALSLFPERMSLSSFMPADLFKRRSKEIIARVESHLSKPGYYDTTYVRHTKLFDALQRSHVDIQRISHHASLGNDVNRPVLATFLPDKDGLCRPPKYDRLSGRTGRLKMASGPSILTLKTEHRDILRSRFPKGKIISIDFSSLEARVFLYSAGIFDPADDIYESVAQRLFAGQYPRPIVKAVVISLLYGMGDTALALKLGMEKAQVRKVTRDLKKHFNYEVLKSRLESTRTQEGISNHYGRVVSVPDDRLLINTFVQSTGVDVALHGFANLVDVMPSGCVPLFVLHDALIADCSDECDMSFVRAAENVPGFEGRYPVHVSSF